MNLSEIKPLKIKLLKAKTPEQEIKALNSFDEIAAAIDLHLNSDVTNEIYYTDITEFIIDQIAAKYSATIREGVSQGCYGSTTGETFSGYTCYMPLELYQEYIDEDNDYAVNPLHEIENNGGEFLDYTEDQIEAYIDIQEDSGIKVHHDNTYNHETENCHLMCDLDIKLFGDLDDENNGMLAVRFHCGGDPRGNYTRWYLVKFDSQYDIYSAILPSRENEEEI